MARQTPNYHFNISEGSDIVNPLLDMFPNFESLDTILKTISNRAVGVATELETNNIHALTRVDTDRDIFIFTATSNFETGDTFTVDAEQVTALTVGGTPLTTGAYVIGSAVLCIKRDSLLTMLVSDSTAYNAERLGGELPSHYATAQGLADAVADILALQTKVGTAVLTTTAPDLSGAVNEINEKVNTYRKVVDISDGVLSTNPTNYNIVEGIDKYKYINATLVSMAYATTVVNYVRIPIEQFKIATDMYAVSNDGVSIRVAYINDNTISLKASHAQIGGIVWLDN